MTAKQKVLKAAKSETPEVAGSALEDHREAIVLMRRRKFKWAQIHRVLTESGVPVSYGALYQWKRRQDIK